MPLPVEFGHHPSLEELRDEIRGLRKDIAEMKVLLVGPEPLALSAEDAAIRLGCGRTQVFRYLKAGKLHRATKLGRKVMITVASIEALLLSDSLQVHQPAHVPVASVRTKRRAAKASRAILDLPLTGVR